MLDKNESEVLWNKMYGVWKKENVPSVRLLKFIPGKHMIKRPWYNLKEKQQESYSASPIFDTAYHLVRNLPQETPEVIAAFKIHAFIRTYYSKHILEEPLLAAFKKHDSNLTWWSHNARYVLPDSEVDGYLYGNELKNKDWQKLVLLAANVWKDISNRRAVIVIPPFMEWSSKEYREYKKYSEEEHEKEGYARYLRLKEKFEDKPNPFPKTISLNLRVEIDELGNIFLKGQDKEGKDFNIELN